MTLRPVSQIQSRAATPMVAPAQPQAAPQIDPTWFETVGAMFGSEYTPTAVYGAVSGWINQSSDMQNGQYFDADFDPFDEISGTDLEAYPEAFINVHSRPQFERAARRLRDEIADRDIISRSSFWSNMTAGLMTGVVDPVNYVAFAAPAARAVHAYRSGRATLAFAREAAIGGLMSTAASEALLHMDQQLRTVEESLGNIAGATVLGGALGAGIGAAVSRSAGRSAREVESMRLAEAAEARFRRAMDDEVASDPNLPPELRDPALRSGDEPPPIREGGTLPQAETWAIGSRDGAGLSAQAVSKAPPTIAGGSKAFGYIASPSRIPWVERTPVVRGIASLFDNPTAWLLQSPLRSVREVAERLAYTPRLAKTDKGIPNEVPVEAMVSVSRGDAAAMTQIGRQKFIEYRYGAKKRLGVLRAGMADFRGQGGGKLSFADFKAAAYDVVRDGVEHADPKVNELAAEITTTLDKIKQDAIEAGALPSNVDPQTATNYIMRIYDVPQIVADRRRFEAILAKWIRENGAGFQAEAINARKVVTDLEAQRDLLISTMTPDEVAIFSAERSRLDAQRRVERLNGEVADLTDGYREATDRLRQLQASPNRDQMKDRLEAAEADAKVAETDLRAAELDHENAIAERDAAALQHGILNDKLKSHPIRKASARLERRQRHLDILRAQSEVADRSLKKLEAEWERLGRGPKVYGEWLNRRAEQKPAGRRPMSLVEAIIKDGGIRDDRGELRKIIEKSVGRTKSGKADRRFALAKLVSDDPNARSLDDATESYWTQGYLGGAVDDEFASRPDIASLLDMIDAEASGGPKTFSTREMTEAAEWEEWDWVVQRKKELESDPDFRAGRAVTRLFNKWKREAADRLALVDAKGATVMRERDAARDALYAMTARAREMEKGRRSIERKIEAERARADSFDTIASRANDDLGEIVRDLVDELVGLPSTASAMNLAEMQVKRRGPLADRTLLIPDTYNAGNMLLDGLEVGGRFDDFVIKDTDRVMGAIVRSTGPDIALHRQFGSVDLADEMKDIAVDAEAFRAMLGRKQETAVSEAQAAGAPPAQINKIVRRTQKLMQRSKREEAEAKRILQVQVARLRGTFTNGVNPNQLWYRFVENMKVINYMRLMGGVVITSAADSAMVARAHGLERVISAAKVAVGDWDSFKEALKTAPQVGQAIDVVLSVRSAAVGDLDSRFIPGTRAEEVLHWVGQRFGNVNLLSQWTDFWKAFDVVIAQDRILNNIETFMRTKTLDPTERTFMADHYLGEQEMSRIWGQWSKTKEARGLRWAELADWDDAEAKRLFSAALARDADFNIITPGLDKPIWLSTPLGSVIGQFKSFTFVSLTRVLGASLQDRDANALVGLGLLMAGGALSFMASSALKGENPFDAPFEKWAGESVDRSGMLGYLTEVNALADKMGIGVNSMLGTKELSRYSSRSAADQLAGPTFGMIPGALSLATGAFSKDVDLTGSDIGFARSLFPGQNLFWGPRRAADEVERTIAEMIGVKPRPAVARQEGAPVQ